MQKGCVRTMSNRRWLISANSLLDSARPGAPRCPVSETVDFFAEAGFEAIDINFSGTILTDPFTHEPMLDGDRWREHMEALRARAQDRGLRIVHSHAPYHHRYDPRSEKYPAGTEMTRRAIEATGLLGGTHIVMHPLMTPDRATTLADETVAALEPLVRYAEGFGVRLAVENMRCTRPETLAEIADRVGADVCWDAGHANICGLRQEESLTVLGSRVKVVHIHDNFGLRAGSLASEGPSCSDLHLPPFLGTINWDSFLRGLDRIGFTGAFNFEVPGSKLPPAVRLPYARYLVRTAEELMDRLPAAGEPQKAAP